MFDELPDTWLPALPSTQLRRDSPVGLVVAGVPLALFRDDTGAARAVVDRCPHRSVRLSGGTVEGGRLVCPFHGWAFDGAGACVSVPLNPGARRDLLGASPVPAAEAGGLVWVHTRVGTEAPPLPKLPESLSDPSVRRRELVETWDAHWTRAMENMLDVPHLPYVHRRTIGREMAARDDLDRIAVTFDLQDTDDGFHLTWAFGGQPDPGSLTWHRPLAMVLVVPTPVGELRQHVFCVPAETGRTRMILVSTSRRPWWARLVPVHVFDGFEDRILLEDRRVVETSPPGPVDAAVGERSVASDLPTLRFRAWVRGRAAA